MTKYSQKFFPKDTKTGQAPPHSCLALTNLQRKFTKPSTMRNPKSTHQHRHSSDRAFSLRKLFANIKSKSINYRKKLSIMRLRTRC